MHIIHLKHYLSNEKALIYLGINNCSVMTKWLHQSSNLSVLRLSPDMGEYNSPQI